MRVQLIGIYSDGSGDPNKAEPLLERSMVIEGRGVDEIFSAKEAVDAVPGGYSCTLVVLKPDEEQ